VRQDLQVLHLLYLDQQDLLALLVTLDQLDLHQQKLVLLDQQVLVVQLALQALPEQLVLHQQFQVQLDLLDQK
jgi:hypothetical protein